MPSLSIPEISIPEFSSPPAGADGFAAMGLSSGVRQAIADLGWQAPTPVQAAVFERMTAGRDLIVQSPTGSGKTAAFGLPLVDRLLRPTQTPQALILAPTRELASQSARELQRLGKFTGLRATAIYGGVGLDAQIEALAAGTQAVSGTPGRVLDLMRRGHLHGASLKIVVLDEADEMLSMGFIQELRAILDQLPTERQTLLFSATVDREVQRLAQRYMRDPELITASSTEVAADIQHFVYRIGGQSRVGDLIRILEVENPEQAVIFCNTKAETEVVAERLVHQGLRAELLNGDLAQKDREAVLRRMHRREIRYLVASDVAARGIDISQLSHVINYSFPETPQQYVHRTGRTGRAGRAGVAISLIGPQEIGALYYLRLQYGISPIERSLPNAREERSRVEADRVALLDQAFAALPEEADFAVARRLLTHPEADRIVAGFVRTYSQAYGPERLVQDAAGLRRAATPALPPAVAPEAVAREVVAKRREGAARPEVSMQTVVLQVGREHGARASEISKLLRDTAGLHRREVGRIQVRDQQTSVAIAASRISVVVQKLAGQSLHDRPLLSECGQPPTLSLDKSA